MYVLYHGRYYNDDPTLIKNIIGMSMLSACYYMRSLGYHVIISSMNGRSYYRGKGAVCTPNQICLSIVNDKVKSYTIG